MIATTARTTIMENGRTDEHACPCPVCGTPLSAEDRFGIMIYVCRAHGVWLFKGKLEEMLWKFSRADAALLEEALKQARLHRDSNVI
jgi:Zn-finger nucleic acid-binding protein